MPLTKQTQERKVTQPGKCPTRLDKGPRGSYSYRIPVAVGIHKYALKHLHWAKLIWSPGNPKKDKDNNGALCAVHTCKHLGTLYRDLVPYIYLSHQAC